VIVAIDGPAASGKSTVAREVAKALAFTYLDTGAMYRAVTLKVIDQGIDPNDLMALAQLAKTTEIRFKTEHAKEYVILDDRDVTEAIRGQDVTNRVSAVSKAASLRKIMVENQRKFAHGHDVVVEGRDIGTVVFPNAKVKIFLNASLPERAKRRSTELAAKGRTFASKDMENEISKRDEIDSTRTESPLQKAKDAIEIDTTGKTVNEVIEEVVDIVRAKITA
jgi:cytidylate kinase